VVAQISVALFTGCPFFRCRCFRGPNFRCPFFRCRFYRLPNRYIVYNRTLMCIKWYAIYLIPSLQLFETFINPIFRTIYQRCAYRPIGKHTTVVTVLVRFVALNGLPSERYRRMLFTARLRLLQSIITFTNCGTRISPCIVGNRRKAEHIQYCRAISVLTTLSECQNTDVKIFGFYAGRIWRKA